MLPNEINRLTWQDPILNAASDEESTEAHTRRWLRCAEKPYKGSPKTSARPAAFDDEIAKTWTSEEIIGPSIDPRGNMVAVRTIAQTDLPVLIVGKKGTCKEVIARFLYSLSHYSHLPFVHLDCELARPEEVLAALTAKHSQIGRCLQAAHSGFHLAVGKTVFLENIANLSLGGQHAVQQALQSTSGGAQEELSLVPKVIRLIASSDVDLLEATRVGSFSRDFYQDLDTFLIKVPALCERLADIPMLVDSFLERHCRKQRQPRRSLSMKAIELLQHYPWPGNLRELWQVMDKFVALLGDQVPSDGQSLLGGGRAVCEKADVDECELIITSLIQTLPRRYHRG